MESSFVKENSFVHWKRGVRDGIPIFLGYVAVSFTFGILAVNAGLTIFQGTLMSAVNYTSAGQFAALGLIAAAASYFELAVTQLVINLRYSLMSCALSQKLDPEAPFYHRFIMSAGVTDEVFGVSVSVPGVLSPYYTYGLMTAALPGWVLGTLLGVTLGNVLPVRPLSALSVALYGMFIAIIIPPAKQNKILMGLIVLSMAASSLFAFLPFLSGISSGFRIIILTVLIAGAAAVLFPVKEAGDAG